MDGKGGWWYKPTIEACLCDNMLLVEQATRCGLVTFHSVPPPRVFYLSIYKKAFIDEVSFAN
jgi:hypothetical protein